MRHVIFLLLSIPTYVIAQDCDCRSNFNWVKKTFEENDAGYALVLHQKGVAAYEQHNQYIMSKLASVNKADECAQVMSEWLHFFRNGHIGIRALVQNQALQGVEEPSKEEIIERFKDWEYLNIDATHFKEYLQGKENLDFEGIWLSEPYTVGIKKIDEEYVGFILKADGVYWREGQVKLRVHSDGRADYYMMDHSKETFDQAELLGSNYLRMGPVTFKRADGKLNDDPTLERFFSAMSTNKPYYEQLNEETSYIRIPTFRGSEKELIDSVLHANRPAILSTKNFIIDIRNNGGGSDRSYRELLPIIYTNPIRSVGLEMYSTPLNNQRMLDFVNKDEYGFTEEEKKWALDSYQILSKHEGAFVNLDSTEVDIISYDTIFPFPMNVAVIINENNGSTAEQFLLDAKQSTKVKLYGTTTAGVLDISNMHFVKSPSKEFELGYCLSKSLRIPHMAIDDKGIQPDFYIDESFKDYQWIEFVKTSLNP